MDDLGGPVPDADALGAGGLSALAEATRREHAAWEARGGAVVPRAHREALLCEVGRLVAADDVAPAAIRRGAALLGVLRQLDDQRRDRRVLLAVHLADRLAVEAVAALFPDPADRPLPPLGWVWAVASPRTWVSGVHEVPPGVAADVAARLPFGLVVVPPDHVDRPWRIASVLHEVGHGADRRLGLSATLGALFARRCPGERAWQGWVEELAADLVAARLGGALARAALRWIVGGVRPEGAPLDDGDARYPPTVVRLAFAERVAGRTDGPGWAEASAAFPDLVRGLEAAFADGDIDALAAGWSPLTGTGTLAVLEALVAAPAADGRGGKEAGARALDGAPEPDPGPPAGALLDALRAVPAPAGVVDVASLAWWHSSAHRRAPGPVEHTGSLRKVPPPALYAAYDELALVGATHASLLAALGAARTLRGAPWDLVEIYFVGEDARLGEVYADPGGAEAWAATRRRARAALAAWLRAGGVARRWRVAEPIAGGLYGAVLARAGERGPEWYAHTSAPLWGEGIAAAPSTDYRHRGADLAGQPELAALLRGLGHLRRAVVAEEGGDQAAPSLLASAATNAAHPPVPG